MVAVSAALAAATFVTAAPAPQHQCNLATPWYCFPAFSSSWNHPCRFTTGQLADWDQLP